MGLGRNQLKSRINKSSVILLVAVLLLSFQNCGKGFQTLDAYSTGSIGSSSLGVVRGTQLTWIQHPLAGTPEVDGYRIYLRINNETSFTLIAQLTDVFATSISLTSLNVTLNQENSNYLQMTAYNIDEESDPTPTICWGRPCN